MNGPLRILCVEDLPEDAELVERELRKSGLSVDFQRVDTEEGLLRALRTLSPDLVVCDYSLAGWDGLRAIEVVAKEAPRTPVIMFTGTLPDEKAVACIRAGAADYVLKSHPVRLPAAVAAAMRLRREEDDRSRAEEALRESERRYRTLVDSAPDAIVTVDSGGRVRSWNAAAEDMFGFAAQEMMGHSIHKVVPERFQQAHEHHLRRHAAHVRPLRSTVAVTARRRDGHEFPAEISLSSVREGAEVSFTAMIRDASDTLAARKAIEGLSRRHEVLLNSAGEGILGLGDDGSVTFANPVALALLGRTAVDLVGEDLRSFVPSCPGGPSEPPCPILASLKEGSAFRGEADFLRGDGSSFPVALSLTPLEEGRGVGGGVLIFEEITLRKAHEGALRASEAGYRSLVDNAPYGIYRSTPEGRFTSVNPALVTMLGYPSKAELLATGLSESVYQDPGDRERLRKSIGASDRRFSIEADWKKKDGTPLVVRLSGRFLRMPDEESQGYEVFVEDLTEQRLLENQLRQAQKMETVGQLTGGIAHDFNNVLAVVLLNTELALASLDRGAPVEPADLRAIYEAARRASSITRKLVGFSRQADLQVEPTNLPEVVRGLTSMLRTALSESVELKVEASDAVGSTLVDPGSIEQIILNLVTNSRDALPNGGRVSVKVQEVDLGEDACRRRPGLTPGRHVCLTVADNGIGMGVETLRRVFDPFFTTKAPGAGTGLGMAMVYGLTKQQKGFVDVESHPGAGTTTRLYFPLCATLPPDVREEVRAAPASAGGDTILVVEDEDNLRTVTARALRSRGFRVQVASNGSDALARLLEHPGTIDLILSDLVLPGMNGLELIDAVHEQHGPIPFVLTSGYTGQTSIERRIDPRIPFIRKPWTVGDLLTVVGKTLAAARSPVVDRASAAR